GLWFDGWEIEATTPPPVLCLSTVTPSNARLIWADLADPDIVAVYNTWLTELIDTFELTEGGSADPSVIYVDVNTAVDGTADTYERLGSEEYFNSDGLHPNQ